MIKLLLTSAFTGTYLMASHHPGFEVILDFVHKNCAKPCNAKKFYSLETHILSKGIHKVRFASSCQILITL